VDHREGAVALELDQLERVLQGVGLLEVMHVSGKLPESVRSKTAGEVMRGDVHHLKQTDTLQDALKLIQLESHSTFPVVDGDKVFQGVILKEDLYECVKTSDEGLETPIADIDLRKFPTTALDAPVPEVVEALLRGGTSKVVVVDGEQKLQGIITLIDLMAEG
ncbi:MAG: CBS domain-containing protein, partial [Verrucomicrobiota bacterium]